MELKGDEVEKFSYFCAKIFVFYLLGRILLKPLSKIQANYYNIIKVKIHQYSALLSSKWNFNTLQ